MAVSTVELNTIARRLRDTANFAYPRANLIRLMDHVQRLLNAHFKFITNTTAPITIATTTSLNAITTAVGVNVSSIEAVRVSGRVLDPVPYRTLVHQDPRWAVRRGSRPLVWSTIGKDYLILAPIALAPVSASDIEIVWTPAKPSTILDNGSTDIVIPDEAVPLLRDLVETLALFTGRRFPEAGEVVARAQQAIDTFATQRDVRMVMAFPS